VLISAHEYYFERTKFEWEGAKTKTHGMNTIREVLRAGRSKGKKAV